MFSNYLLPLPVAPCRSASHLDPCAFQGIFHHFSSFFQFLCAPCQGQPSAFSPWEILGGASEIASRMRYWKRVSTDFRRFTSWRSTNCCDSLVITGQSPCRFSVCPSGLASLRYTEIEMNRLSATKETSWKRTCNSSQFMLFSWSTANPR